MSSVQLGFNAANCGIKAYNYTPPTSNCVYASPTGLATNAGTLASPTSLSSAVSKVVNGGTIVLRGGTYRDAGGITMNNSKSWSMIAYQNEQPILDGTKDVTSSWVQEGTAYKTPFTLVHPTPITPMDNAQYLSTHQFLKNFHQVFLDDAYLVQVGSLAACTGNTFYVDTVNKQLYIGVNPSGKTVSYSSRMHALNTNSPGNYVTSFPLQIKGIQFRRYADVAMRVTVKNSLVENCRVFNCGKTGIIVHGDITVKNCHLRNIGMRGIGGSIYAPTIQDVLIENSCIYKYSPHWEASGIKISGNAQVYDSNIDARTVGVNGLISNCKVVKDISLSTMENIGIWFDVHMSRSRVKNCYVENYNVGVLNEISQRNYVYGNTINKCNVGLMHWHSQGAVFANNTIIDAAYGIQVVDEGRRDADKFTHDILTIKPNYITRGLKLYNNLIIGSRYHWDDTRFISVRVYGTEPTSLYITESKNNVFVRRNKLVNGVNKAMPVNIYRAPVNGAYKLIPTVSMTRTDLLLEQNSKALAPSETVITASFIPVSNNVINAGMPLNAELAAIMELPVNTVTDVGSYQSVETTTPPVEEPEPTPTPDPCATQNDRIASLEQTIDDLNSSLADSAITLGTVQAALSALQATHETTLGELTAAHSQVTQLQQQLATLQATHETTLGQLTAAQSQVTQLQQQVTELTTQIAALNTQIASLEDALADALDTPPADCTYIQQELDSKTTQLTTALAEVDALTVDLVNTTADMIAAQAEVEELRMRVDLENQARNLLLLSLDDYVKYYLVHKDLTSENVYIRVLVSDSIITTPI